MIFGCARQSSNKRGFVFSSRKLNFSNDSQKSQQALKPKGNAAIRA